MNDAIAFIVCTVSLLVSLILALNFAEAVARWAAGFGLRHGVVSPVDERSSHDRPTSRLGGVALAVGFLVPSALLVTVLVLAPRGPLVWGANLDLMRWLGLGALLMFGVGLADDLWDLPASVKLCLQILAALILLPADIRFVYLQIPPPPGFTTEMAATFAAVCWVVFFVNVFNFMDGSDGFAARFALNVCAWIVGTVFFQAGLMGFVFFLRAEFLVVLILGAALQGFYRVNHPPARVFMGDSGSHLVGYLLAVLLLMGDGNRFATWPNIAPSIRAVPAGSVALFLFPFYFDVLVTLVRRARLGQNLFKPHREHLYQRLLRSGMEPRELIRLNLRYFHLCGLAGFANALLPEAAEDIEPWVFALARVGLWLTALLALTHYWRSVVGRERAAGASAPKRPAEA